MRQREVKRETDGRRDRIGVPPGVRAGPQIEIDMRSLPDGWGKAMKMMGKWGRGQAGRGCLILVIGYLLFRGYPGAPQWLNGRSDA